jgi:hypothetical protein
MRSNAMLKALMNLIRGQKKPEIDEHADKPVSYTLRDGEMVETGEVFSAWTSQDLDKMTAALDEDAHPVDRHFLLMTIVDEAYKQRDDPAKRDLCARIAEQHIAEFPDLKQPLIDSVDGILPRVTTFQKYALLLTEQGDYERAIEVCETALSHGLHDGTKSGFQGRIERIKKKRERN